MSLADAIDAIASQIKHVPAAGPHVYPYRRLIEDWHIFGDATRHPTNPWSIWWEITRTGTSANTDSAGQRRVHQIEAEVFHGVWDVPVGAYPTEPLFQQMLEDVAARFPVMFDANGMDIGTRPPIRNADTGLPVAGFYLDAPVQIQAVSTGSFGNDSGDITAHHAVLTFAVVERSWECLNG